MTSPQLCETLIGPKVYRRIGYSVDNCDSVALPEGEEPLLSNDMGESTAQRQLPNPRRRSSESLDLQKSSHDLKYPVLQ